MVTVGVTLVEVKEVTVMVCVPFTEVVLVIVAAGVVIAVTIVAGTVVVGVE